MSYSKCEQSLKRKDPDQQLLSTVKKFKQEQYDYTDFPISYEDLPYLDPSPEEVEFSDMVPVDMLVTSVPEVPLESQSDEKAIILYKPMSPPLFPVRPITGVPTLPIRVNLSGYNGILNLHNYSSSKGCALFASTPEASFSQDDKMGSSISVSEKNLALIPWVPTYPPLEKSEAGEQLCSDILAEMNEMPIGDNDNVEEMEEENSNECIEAGLSTAYSTFSSEPWQLYGAMEDNANIPSLSIERSSGSLNAVTFNFMVDSTMDAIDAYLHQRRNLISQNILTGDF